MATLAEQVAAVKDLLDTVVVDPGKAKTNNRLVAFLEALAADADAHDAYIAAPVVPTYTVANLPATATTGQLAFASDALKNGETSPNGTGNLVFFDGTNWIAADTGATAAA